MSVGYRGIINIPIGSRYGVADIDPPQQEGNCLQVVGISLGMDAQGETGNDSYGVILSVKGTPRVSWDLHTDGIPADAVFATMLSKADCRLVNDYLKDAFLFGEGYVSQYPFVLDKCRMLVYAQDANIAGADLDIAYELHFQEVRITNELQQSLLAKIYT